MFEFITGFLIGAAGVTIMTLVALIRYAAKHQKKPKKKYIVLI